MLKKLWNWLRPKSGNRQGNNAHYDMGADGILNFTYHWNYGEEEQAALMIYLINSGMLLSTILDYMKKMSDNDPAKSESFGIVLSTLHKLYEEEAAEMEENDSIIDPSEVFNQHNDEK